LATSIAAAVEPHGAATQEIVRNVAQAATGTGEVTRNIAGVAKLSEGTGVAATQVLASASALSRQSERLNGVGPPVPGPLPRRVSAMSRSGARPGQARNTSQPMGPSWPPRR
jgi:hypothetical protein